MPVIKLKTFMIAPIERCFNLSLSIDLHMDSTIGTNEKAIAGVTSGIIKQGETVTWEAKHFGIKQQLTTLITKVDYPNSFEDEMVTGVFKKFHHTHLFEQNNEITIMKDIFKFEAPYGIIGNVFNSLVLNRYMRNFLLQRNQIIKRVAESDMWKKYLEI